MDDQSQHSPMTEFLLSLQQKPSATTVQEPPADAAGEPVSSAPSLYASHAAPVVAMPAAEQTVGASEDAPSDALTSSSATEAKTEAANNENPQTIEANKVRIITKALRAMEQNIANIIRLLEDGTTAGAVAALESTESVDPSMVREAELAGVRQVDGRVIEGVFDGCGMVGSDGKIYTVPPNYASKSKLVEGDMLKLTITSKGSFIYKQIGPIERARIVATLGFDATNGEFYATQDNRRWSIIKASVTYFKGEPEDEVILLVPKNAPSRWAAVENIIKQTPIV